MVEADLIYESGPAGRSEPCDRAEELSFDLGVVAPFAWQVCLVEDGRHRTDRFARATVHTLVRVCSPSAARRRCSRRDTRPRMPGRAHRRRALRSRTPWASSFGRAVPLGYHPTVGCLNTGQRLHERMARIADWAIMVGCRIRGLDAHGSAPLRCWWRASVPRVRVAPRRASLPDHWRSGRGRAKSTCGWRSRTRTHLGGRA